MFSLNARKFMWQKFYVSNHSNFTENNNFIIAALATSECTPTLRVSHLSLLLSGPLFELWVTPVQAGSTDFVHAHFLFICETKCLCSFLRKDKNLFCKYSRTSTCDHLLWATTFPKHQKCFQSKPYTGTSHKRPPAISDCDHFFGWQF